VESRHTRRKRFGEDRVIARARGRKTASSRHAGREHVALWAAFQLGDRAFEALCGWVMGGVFARNRSLYFFQLLLMYVDV